MTNPAAPVTDPRPAPPSHRREAILAAVAIVIALGVWLAFRQPPDLVQGMVDADTIHVAAKITARVASLDVREGDRVVAGQALFVLDSPEVRAKVAQAEAAVAAASALAAKADEGARVEDIAAARANWQHAVAADALARATWTRVEALHAQGVMTRQKRDEALAQRDGAEQATAAARARYDQALAGARSQDKDAAQARLAQARATLAEIESSRDETHGHAPLAAQVDKRLADLGELVPAGYPVFTLVDIDHPWVAFHLRESQFARIAIGHRLVGKVPALDLDEASFEVYYVSPAGDFATWRATRQSSGYDVRSFEVRARPSAPIAGLRPGMSVLFDWPQDGG